MWGIILYGTFFLYASQNFVYLVHTQKKKLSLPSHYIHSIEAVCGEILGLTSQLPSISKSNWLHVDTF